MMKPMDIHNNESIAPNVLLFIIHCLGGKLTQVSQCKSSVSKHGHILGAGEKCLRL